MTHPVLASLAPVVLLIATGFIAGRVGWIRAEGAKDLSNLVFMVLTPALLFRTMSKVHIEQLDFKPVALYFVVAIFLFVSMLLWRGVTRRSAVMALTVTFGNTLAIGAPLVTLAYGQEALVVLLTLISVHALILLTLATLVLEWAVAREGASAGTGGLWSAVRQVLTVVRNGIFHPVPLPIILGLLFAQTDFVMPEMLDQPLRLLGGAFGPMALVLVGLTLAFVQVKSEFKAALGLTLVKNLLFPALVAALSVLGGLRGMPLTVMIVAASLPIGANVFLFSQRYQVAQDLVTASVAMSTVMALVSVSLVMTLVTLL